MLSGAERTDARRYMGYPAHGADGSFQQAFGAVEYRLGALSGPEETVLRRYLGTLAVLEQAIPAATAGLDTGSAAGWVRNPAELEERRRLFDDWRRRLCGFVGVPAGPGLQGRGSGVSLVV